MNKEKAKTITLGVSIALNILGSLLIGGSLIHSCNAPASHEIAPLSVSSASAGKLHAPTPRNALESTSVDVSEFENLWDENENLSINGRVLYRSGVELWVTASSQATNGKVFTMELRQAGFYYMRVVHPSPTWGSQALLTADGLSSILSTASGASSNLTSESIWTGGNGGFFYISETDLFRGSSDGTLYLCASQNSVIGSNVAPEVYLIDNFEMISDHFQVPADFWGYRLLNGSPDSTSGGVIVPNEASASAWGAIRLSNLCFALGDSKSVYTSIEFNYFNLYSRSFLDSSGNVVTASADSFKSVWYLDYIRVLPYGKDSSVANNWVMIGVSVNGVDANGNRYVNAHAFNWLDNSYKTFHLWDVKEPASSHVTTLGNVFQASWLNPTINGLSLNSALRLAMLGTSASGGNGQVIGGGTYTDVFTLIGSAFSSLAPILSIQVLPFLTIGTLLLVPLVVLIIFAILKVLNK